MSLYQLKLTYSCHFYIDSLERSVQDHDDVQLVKNSPLVRTELSDRARVFIYDLKMGEVKPVAQ